ncbi:hypothetical protein BpHYR1_033253, partial [Brachionus plicatilis]
MAIKHLYIKNYLKNFQLSAIQLIQICISFRNIGFQKKCGRKPKANFLYLYRIPLFSDACFNTMNR